MNEYIVTENAHSTDIHQLQENGTYKRIGSGFNDETLLALVNNANAGITVEKIARNEEQLSEVAGRNNIALRTRIETWIANAERNNRDDQNKLNGASINRLYIIDGMFARNLRIEAWKDVLKVMR